VIDALGVVESKDDIEAVQAVIRAVYLPWLETSALAFQKLVKAGGAAIQSTPPASVSDVAKGTAILFADGLRYDLAQKLKARLAENGLQLELAWRWTALPTVTPTAKPAASPITHLFAGDEGCEEFKPRIKDGGKDQVASYVAAAPLRRWLTNRSFEDFYQQLWQKSKELDCPEWRLDKASIFEGAAVPAVVAMREFDK